MRGKYIELNSAKVFHPPHTQDVMLSEKAMISHVIVHNSHVALIVEGHEDEGHYMPRTVALRQGRDVEFPENGSLVGMVPDFGGDPYWVFEVGDAPE